MRRFQPVPSPAFAMHPSLPLASLILLTACASAPDGASERGRLGTVQERKIVSSTMERSASRPQVPIRERAMSSQPFQESALKPVYEHLVVLEDGRTLRVQSTSAAHAPGQCVRVVEGDGAVAPRVSASTGCRAPAPR
jgi:hypothetical protein